MIEGKAIRIRPIKKEDVNIMFQWSNETACSYFMLEGLGIRSLTEMLSQHEDPANSELIVEIKSKPPKPIGLIKVGAISTRDKRTEIYIKIFDRYYLDKAETKEAISLFLNYLFESANNQKVYIWYLQEEKEDIDILLQSGFITEGVSREQVFFNGTYHNLIALSMLEEEYSKVKHEQR